MVDKIYLTAQFRKGLKELKKKHNQTAIDRLDEIITKLKNQEIDTQYDNHKLISTVVRDIHIEPNLILLYRYKNEEMLIISLELNNLVNHGELDRKSNKKYINKTSIGVEEVPLDYSVKDESLEEDFDLSKLSNEDCYKFLGRMKADCDYFLGNGNRAEKHLWSGNVEDQIKDMRYLYNRVKEKPEWLSKEDIDNYEKRMIGESLTEDYSDRYYQTGDKLIYRLDNIRYSQGVEKPYAELSLSLVCGWDYCDTESDRMGWVDADNWVSDVQSKYIVVYLEEESINSALEYEGLEPCDRPSTIWKYNEEKDRYIKM